MYTAFKQSFIEWNKSANERVKLQYAYATLALLLLVVSGLVSLVNDQLGVQLLTVTFGLAVLFFVNLIAWALLDSLVLSKLPKNSSRRK